MKEFRNFLESSTVHGLSYISTTRNFARLFWIFVVITGFSGAMFLIHESFKSWDESPVSTTIETLSISKIKFPKVTVCPPKLTYTDLNYDLLMAENMTLASDIRQNLSAYAVELLQDHLHTLLKANFSKLQEKDKYRNWYKGYSKIKGPLFDSSKGRTYYRSSEGFAGVMLYTTSGIISSEHYGEKFDAGKVEANVLYELTINFAAIISNAGLNLGNGDSATLHVEIERVSIDGYGEEKLLFDNTIEDKINQTHNYPLESGAEFKTIKLERKVSMEDVKKMEMEKMPGFKMKWYYTGASAGQMQSHNEFGQSGQSGLTHSFIR